MDPFHKIIKRGQNLEKNLFIIDLYVFVFWVKIWIDYSLDLLQDYENLELQLTIFISKGFLFTKYIIFFLYPLCSHL